MFVIGYYYIIILCKNQPIVQKHLVVSKKEVYDIFQAKYFVYKYISTRNMVLFLYITLKQTEVGFGLYLLLCQDFMKCS